MKTKLILHGGFSRDGKEENDAFFKEILSGTSKKVKILLVYFAKETDRIPKNKEEDVEQFNKNKGSKILTFQVASEESFSEQVKWADVLYLHGGRSVKILDTMKKIPNIKQVFEGKIVAGDSAGANVLVTIFYSKVADKVLKGLGIISINLICHYTEAYKSKLDGYNSKLGILLLPEYEYKVFNI